MTKVRMKVTAEDVKKAMEDRGGAFDVPKPGIYVLGLTELESGYSKDADGNEDKSRPRLQAVYKIVAERDGTEDVEPKGNYGNIWDYVSFSKESAWKRAEFLFAFGFIDDTDTDPDTVEFDTDDLVNRKVVARLKHEKGRDKDSPPRAKIAKLFPYGSEIGGGLDFDNGSVSFSEPDGDAAESFSAEEEGEQAWTEDDFAELDLKQIGEIAKEFGLDPNDFIVRKGKKLDTDATRAGVIGAILEAQGSDESDEESPF